MTQTTDTERVMFEEFASVNGKRPELVARNQAGKYLRLDTATGWMWWQAARRAPAVPQGWKLVPVEPTEDQLWCLYGRFVGQLTTEAKLYSDMLAAAPQPPIKE